MMVFFKKGDETMTKGQRIKEKRESLNMSQAELAREAKISKQTLYKYEKDLISNIPSDAIERIAKALNCNPSYIMGWSSNVTDTVQHGRHGRLIDADLMVKDLEKQCVSAVKIKPADFSKDVVFMQAVWASWFEAFIKYLNARPTVIADPGKEEQWIYHTEIIPSTIDSPEEIDWESWICTKCGQPPTDDYDEWSDIDIPPKFNFCPNCGAKMKKVE